MNHYFIAIQTAFFIFPFLAIAVTLPYMILQYRKYGSIPWLRSVIFYTFTLYLLCMYLLIILPLPPINEVLNDTSPTTQLIPFQFVRDFMRETVFDVHNFETWMTALKQNCFLQPVFNILLFVPFGIYIHYYSSDSIKKVILLSFSLSLFFELTQLSGLYGIYPRGYRLFDIDDLILNTWGGLLGFWIEPIFIWILPTRTELDKKAYQNGRNVSYFRRATACCIDGFIILFVALFINMFGAGLYYILILYFLRGYTPGTWLLRYRIATQNGKTLTLFQCCIRNGILYFGWFISFPLMLLAMFFGIIMRRQNEHRLFYEWLSKTECLSEVRDVFQVSWN